MVSLINESPPQLSPAEIAYQLGLHKTIKLGTSDSSYHRESHRLQNVMVVWKLAYNTRRLKRLRDQSFLGGLQSAFYFVYALYERHSWLEW